MTTKFKKSFSPMLICWNDIKIHLGFEDSYLVPPPNITKKQIWRPNNLGYMQFCLCLWAQRWDIFNYWGCCPGKPIVCTLSTPRLQASFPRPHPSHDATSVDDDTTRRAIHPLPQRISTPVTKCLVPPTMLDADVSTKLSGVL